MANLAAYQKISRVLGGDWGDAKDGSSTTSSDPNTRATITGTATQTTGTAGSTDFANGDLVFLIQSQGTSVGQYEWNLVSSGGGTTSLTFATALQYTYGTGAQIVKVPRYLTATISSFTATNWNGTTGGITIICAKTISGSGNITIDGGAAKNGSTGQQVGGGYRGGESVFTDSTPVYSYSGEGSTGNEAQQTAAKGNGGGGGLRPAGNSNTAIGAGGSHATQGTAGTSGDGCTSGTPGNTVGSADLTSLFMGGGGGARTSRSADGGGLWGYGAAGAGIIILIADTIDWTGYVYSRGGAANNDGGSAAAGGSILVICRTGAFGTNRLVATGGAAGSGTGAGGLGRIAVHHSGTVTGTTSPTFTDVTDLTLRDISGAFLAFM